MGDQFLPAIEPKEKAGMIGREPVMVGRRYQQGHGPKFHKVIVRPEVMSDITGGVVVAPELDTFQMSLRTSALESTKRQTDMSFCETQYLPRAEVWHDDEGASSAREQYPIDTLEYAVKVRCAVQTTEIAEHMLELAVA